MRGKVFVLLIIFGLVFAGVASAATVSMDSYRKSCTTCSFDSNGKMDQKCWEEIQDGAKVDLAVAYPGMSFKYQWGDGCKPLDQCIAALQSCKALHTSGNDQTDCVHNRLTYCFKSADACAEAANKICSEGKSEDESGIKDIIGNMTTKENYTEPDVPEPEIREEDIMNCVFGFLIIGFSMVGAAFYCRK
jgi:hypothetical protein